MIKEKLDKSGRKFRYRCDVATLKNLGERLDEGCAMLHYAGHGNNEYVCFESEDDCGVMQPIAVRFGWYFVSPRAIYVGSGQIR